LKISCIIPVKNRENFIVDAVKSVINQKTDVYEIIIVDDGSTDNTIFNLNENFAGQENLKIISSSGLGAGRARNLGASKATGAVFMFLDSDDVWFENHSQTLLDGHLKGYEASFGKTLNHNHFSGEKFYIPDDGFINQNAYIFNQLIRWCFLVPSSFSITRGAFERTSGFSSEILGEDWLFFLRLSENYEFFYNCDIITFRNLHKESICHRDFACENILNLMTKIEDVAINSIKTQKEDIEWLKKAIKLIELQGKGWKTVQDWFMGLKTENLL
jgi:glycosyltransferase involved in cell wall biosynthesis